jgi:hypothetical protein
MRNQQKGSAMIETALVFGVLLAVVIGIVDLSRLAYARSLMPHIAQEGARFAAVRGPAGIEAYVRSQAVGIAPGDLRVTAWFTEGPEAEVTVEAVYAYRPVAGGGGMEIRGSGVMPLAR